MLRGLASAVAVLLLTLLACPSLAAAGLALARAEPVWEMTPGGRGVGSSRLDTVKDSAGLCKRGNRNGDEAWAGGSEAQHRQ